MNPPAELSQWLGFSEESILLQDGLLRLGDLIEVPQGALFPYDEETKIQHFLNLDNNNTDELSHRIEQICNCENSGFKNLLQYRLNALKSLWKAKRDLAKWKIENEKVCEEPTVVSLRQRKNANSMDSSTAFSSKLSLLLIFPLIKSQAKFDPSLCEVTTNLLLQSLRECPPLSLKEPVECLNGIEDLLCSWLGENEDGTISEVLNQAYSQTTAAALVTLACARNSIKTVLHTVHILQQIKGLEELPVHDIVSILGALEGGPNIPATLNSNKHISWIQLSITSYNLVL